MTTDLLFKGLAAGALPANLLFGADTVSDSNLTLSSNLPAPTLVATLGSVFFATLSAPLPGPTLAALVSSDARAVDLAATLPAPVLDATLLQPLRVTLAAALPAPTLSGFLYPGVRTWIDATLPLPTFTGTFGGPIDFTVDGALPLPTFTGTFGEPIDFVLESSAFPAMTMAATVEYRSYAERPTVFATANPWQIAVPVEAGAHSPHQVAVPQPEGVVAPWRPAVAAEAGVVARHQDAIPAGVRIVGRHQDAIPARTGRWSSFQDGKRDLRPRIVGRYQDGLDLRRGYASRFQDGLRDRRRSLRAKHQDAIALRNRWGTDYQTAVPLPFGRSSKFQQAIVPRPGMWVRPGIVVPPPMRCYTTPLGNAVHLLFNKRTATTDLVFVCERKSGDLGATATVVVPIRSVYIMLNNVSLRRVAGNIFLPTLSMSLTLDAESWTWGFSAMLPASSLADIEPSGGDPVELEASINGTLYRVVVEQVARQRAFNRATISIRGRGKNAILDVPYSPVEDFNNAADARTIAQLMDDVLMLNGVPIGWDVDFGLTDWLVPAGSWSHQGSRMGALNRIAEAGGGYIQPHATAQTIRVLSRYPLAPWDWASVTPDFEIPSAVMSTEGIEWSDKVVYNRVFVSGQGSGGILGQVTREGTAGDVLAPMVVDPLITHADAARQRGTRVLSDTGRQAHVSLRLPVLAETGVITPGKFVRYVDGATTRLGLVRSTSLDVKSPELWQTIGVETHVA